MSHTYTNSHHRRLTSYERGYFRTRMWADLGKMSVGMGLVIFGVQFVSLPTAGVYLAGFIVAVGAYLFVRGFCRRAEDYFERKDLTYTP